MEEKLVMLKKTTPIVKCSSCKEIMTQTQFSKHTCEPEHKGTKIIPVFEIIDLTSKADAKKLLATGFDGIDYLFEVQKPLAIPFITDSRRILTGTFKRNRTDGDFTESIAPLFKLQIVILGVEVCSVL